MPKIAIVLTAILAGLAGACASPDKRHERVLKAWKGMPATALARSWGKPSRITEGLDYSLIEYVRGHRGMHHYMYCRTIFKIQDRRISGWRYEGNHCGKDRAETKD